MVAAESANTANYCRRKNSENHRNNFFSVEVVRRKVCKHDDVANIECQCEKGMNECKNSKKEEETVVAFANTSTDPWTMMVVHLNTGMTIRAVKRSWWSVNATSPAFQARYFRLTNKGHMVNFDLLVCRKKHISYFSLHFHVFSGDDSRICKSCDKQKNKRQQHSAHVECIYQAML